MIANRYILRKNNISEKNIAELIRKGRTLNAAYCLKTAKIEKNRIMEVGHFDTDVLIEKLKKSIDTARADYAKASQRLVKILESIEMTVL